MECIIQCLQKNVLHYIGLHEYRDAKPFFPFVQSFLRANTPFFHASGFTHHAILQSRNNLAIKGLHDSARTNARMILQNLLVSFCTVQYGGKQQKTLNFRITWWKAYSIFRNETERKRKRSKKGAVSPFSILGILKIPSLSLSSLLRTYIKFYMVKGVLHPRTILRLFVHFSQKIQQIGDK